VCVGGYSYWRMGFCGVVCRCVSIVVVVWVCVVICAGVCGCLLVFGIVCVSVWMCLGVWLSVVVCVGVFVSVGWWVRVCVGGFWCLLYVLMCLVLCVRVWALLTFCSIRGHKKEKWMSFGKEG